MAINFSKGGGQGVPPKTLRYVNKALDQLKTGAEREIAEVMGTGGTGIPGVTSTFTYNRRDTNAVVDASGEYSLRVTGNTEIVVNADWKDITSIVLFDSSANARSIVSVANAITANGNHIRVFKSDSVWGYFLITAIVTTGTGTTLTVVYDSSVGDVDLSTSSNENVFIGFDIGVGIQGDDILGVDITLTPSGISQTPTSWTDTSIVLSARFASGDSIVSINSLDTIAVATNGDLTPSTGDRSNVAVTIDGKGYQYDITYSDSNRTVTIRLEATNSALIAEDVATLTIGERGDTGENAIITRIEEVSGSSSMTNNTGSVTFKAFLLVGGTKQPDQGVGSSRINSYEWSYTPEGSTTATTITNGTIDEVTGNTSNTHTGTALEAFDHYSIIVEADGTALGTITGGGATFTCEIDYT